MTHEEALGQIYAIRESIANGWKHNHDQELALALADMLDEVKVDAERYRWLRDRLAVEDIERLVSEFWGTPDELESIKTDSAIDTARSNHESF